MGRPAPPRATPTTVRIRVTEKRFSHLSIPAVTLTNSLGADDVGSSNDASGTVRVHGSNVALYNLNIINSRGAVSFCSQRTFHY